MQNEDTRLSVEHMATTLYSERIEEDKAKGVAGIYRANPDARALYFKGIHDVLMILDEWTHMGVAPNTLGMFIEALQTQTRDASRAH